MASGSVVIPRAWRSEISTAVAFILLCPVAYALTVYLPFTVITGPLIEIQGMVINLSLPLAIFIPAGVLFQGLYRIYNVRYLIDPRGLEARHGILSPNQMIVRIRFEDIRAMDVQQSVIDRLLDIGKMNISTAASSDVEIVMTGIGAPYYFRQVIQFERDKRQGLGRKERAEGFS